MQATYPTETRPAEPLSKTLLPGVPLIESMMFNLSVDDMGLSNVERDIAVQLHENGFAVFDFPDDDLGARIERIKASLTPHYDFEAWREHGWAENNGLRVQDAWKFDADVKAIAANQTVIELLSKLYGRRAFPFQTLNFPVGTQQHYHSDSIHFSSIPERFMCGVWLALEDIDPRAGPLVYYPGSHRWPILYGDAIGKVVGDERGFLAQTPYEQAWRGLVQATGAEPEYFMPKKGQALIWAANLLHGGSRQTDPGLTRWSQVTHYYFEDCTYFTPAYSDPMAGNLYLREMTDLSTGKPQPNTYVDRPFAKAARTPGAIGAGAGVGMEDAPSSRLPPDFDPARYLMLNPDVAKAGMDAKRHYLKFGWRENRQHR